jgi:CRP/FNR family transcriptional regulator, cyclic AMP receptor protein
VSQVTTVNLEGYETSVSDSYPLQATGVHPALRAARLFEGMTPSDIDAITPQFQTILVDRGRVLFREGDPATCLYVVVSGKVKLGRSFDDRQLLTSVLGPSGFFGELSLFDPGPRAQTATVVTDGQIACVSGRALWDWIADRPHLAAPLVRGLSRRVKHTNTALLDLVLVDVAGRLAKVLLQLAHTFGTVEGTQVRVQHDLTQEELAHLVGASRETVNKALTSFAARGWLRVETKTVVILEPDRLRRRTF